MDLKLMDFGGHLFLGKFNSKIEKLEKDPIIKLANLFNSYYITKVQPTFLKLDSAVQVMNRKYMGYQLTIKINSNQLAICVYNRTTRITSSSMIASNKCYTHIALFVGISTIIFLLI